MRVKVNHGPRFGEITHVERNQTTTLLLTLGLIEEMPEEPARPVPQHGQAAPLHVETPQWGVGISGEDVRPAIIFRFQKEKAIYTGPVAQAADFRPRGGESGPPAATIEAYRVAVARDSGPRRSANDRQEIEVAMARQKDLPPYKLPRRG